MANTVLQEHWVNFKKHLDDEAKKPAKGRRAQIKKEIRRETDSFYELDQAGSMQLPTLSRSLLRSPLRANRVRVTRNEFGEETAKIVKLRVQDIEMIFPSSEFDCRVSVNVEAKYTGDVADLVECREAGRPVRRRKDRSCYIYQASEIHLTQVLSEADGRKTHEAEIEVDQEAFRQEFSLVCEGLTNKLEDIVHAFMDNIRELARLPLRPPT